jgi:hypothetical protein
MKKIITSISLSAFHTWGFAQGTVYSGDHNTTSQGGLYKGATSGSSHKDGMYSNSSTSNHYCRHKK